MTPPRRKGETFRPVATIVIMPHNVDPDVTELPSLDFSSGYVQRSIAKLPKQGSKRPWRLYQNYALDIVTLRYGRVDDGVMQYS